MSFESEQDEGSAAVGGRVASSDDSDSDDSEDEDKKAPNQLLMEVSDGESGGESECVCVYWHKITDWQTCCRLLIQIFSGSKVIDDLVVKMLY